MRFSHLWSASWALEPPASGAGVVNGVTGVGSSLWKLTGGLPRSVADVVVPIRPPAPLTLDAAPGAHREEKLVPWEKHELDDDKRTLRIIY
jgi:hypothetical protein